MSEQNKDSRSKPVVANIVANNVANMQGIDSAKSGSYLRFNEIWIWLVLFAVVIGSLKVLSDENHHDINYLLLFLPLFPIFTYRFSNLRLGNYVAFFTMLLVIMAGYQLAMTSNESSNPQEYLPGKFTYLCFILMISSLGYSFAKRAQKLKTEYEKEHQTAMVLANKDDLTGLANRLSIETHLRLKILQENSPDAKSPVALILIDLDKFKPINDEYGHDVGDAVLIQTAQRLRTVFRNSDIVGRLGGDEFAIIQDAQQNAGKMEDVIQRTEQTISQAMQIAGLELSVGASIGYALFPNDASDFDTLFRRADERMYTKKRQKASRNR